MNESTNLPDTIAALATAPGPAALSIVRMSGPRALEVAQRVLTSRAALADQPGHTVVLARARAAGGEGLDQVLVTVFRAPRSYSGEDVLEISCHGGDAAAGAVLAALVGAGARLAEPGEFTRRAYEHGKLDLSQAEAVVDLIQARTGRARESALARLQGEGSRRIQALALRTREVLLDCEAFLDFQEQLPEDFDWDLRAQQCEQLAREVQDLLGGAAAGRRLHEGARVVLTGRPNVGKSSLLNALLSEERALVSDIPGTTRDALRETMDLGGIPVTLVDTAGLRPGSADVLERAGMERARQELAQADAVVAVVDVSEAPRPEDLEMLGALRGRRGVLAANKVDLGDAWGGEALPLDWSAVRTSAHSGVGVSELGAQLRRALAGDVGREPGLVGSVREESALRSASGALRAAAERLQMRELLDTASFELREALRAFDEAVGVGVSEDVLNEIFRRFCVGK